MSDTFEPYKKTLGQLLISTSPAMRVPDYQRDYSWDKEQIQEFWEDLYNFIGSEPVKTFNKEYFLGAIVLVDNGTYNLVLDGQQRLATATILIAALRDKMREYKQDAAQQLQNQFIVFEDALTGERIPRLELNIFDREYFRELVQIYPRSNEPIQSKKSHQLIHKAYSYFSEKVNEFWDKSGGGREGFEWAGRFTIILRQYVVLITAVSKNERSAASIFTALNDRGIGLSTVDLVRSHILQRAHESQRDGLLQYWNRVFEACGNDTGVEALMRTSWVSLHGDLKTRALYKVISDFLDKQDSSSGALKYSQALSDDALFYRRLRDGDTDDPELEQYWLNLRFLKFNSGSPLLMAAARKFSAEEQKTLAKSLMILVLRHNTICNLDRASLESLAFSCAKDVSDGNGLQAVLRKLRERSPNEKLFSEGFNTLSFSPAEHGIARCLLELINDELTTTSELDIANSSRVHVEHIQPQTPLAGEEWQSQATHVKRFGNLTLLDKRLNIQIKNARFPIKKQAYAESRLEITKQLLGYDDWSPSRVEERQANLFQLAQKIWPEKLVDF